MFAKTFNELRRKIHAQCLTNFSRRLRNGSLRPTLQEIAIGAFLEELESQVAGAILEMNRKGYCTWSSGFYGKKANIQGIDGPFVLDNSTTAKLEEAGAKVETEKFFGTNYTSITFHPQIVDSRLIKRRWLKLISLIPAKGYPAILPDNYGSFEFREHFMRRRARIMRLERLIGAKRNPRWMKQWQRQLKNLKRKKLMRFDTDLTRVTPPTNLYRFY